MLGLLTTAGPGHPCFHVVAPSLPGYAWSEGVSKRGFHSREYAEVGPDPLPEQPDRFSYLHNFWKLLNKLMISLGYTEYVTQGGDWGHTVRRYAFLTLLLLRLTDAIPCLANVRHGIAVWSPTCQGIPHQFPSVKILSPHHRC